MLARVGPLRVRLLVARLLAESRKAGLHVLLICQRAEAAIIGAAERSQCALRLSFRVDNHASIELLHPGALPDLTEAHTTAAPGIALLTSPGQPLARIRGPWIGGYSEFARMVSEQVT